MNIIKYKLCIIFSLFFISAISNITDSVVFPSSKHSVNDIQLNNVIVSSDSGGRNFFTLSDLTYIGNSDPYISDIVLSFNKPSNYLVKDDTEKYIITKSSFKFINKKGTLGNGGAAFLKNDHAIEIENSQNLWLGCSEDLGSFTIEFRFCPLSMKDDSILFSRVGYFSGKKSGIDIILKNGRIIVGLYKLFKDDGGRKYNIFLNRGRVLEEKKWHHFTLSFDRISGKLAKYINGYEDDVVFVTEKDEPFVGVYKPSFECVDLPPVILCQDYCGYFDEFRISYRQIDDLKRETDIAYNKYKELGVMNRIPMNQVGSATSPVYAFKSTGTSVTLFKWSELLRKNTFIWMEFRVSDSLFDIYNSNLKWHRISNNQKNIYLKKDKNGYLRGKYYQWRAHLIPSPDGKFSPTLNNVEIIYRLDPPPGAPLIVEIVSYGDSYVRLRWNKRVEHDIFGYRIYYGVRSKKYDGIISYINGSRITNELNINRNYIELEITNSVIEENIKKDKRGILDYPLLKNTILYFFSVSAYDSYKPDTPYNHESTLSAEVKARPFAGSEI